MDINRKWSGRHHHRSRHMATFVLAGLLAGVLLAGAALAQDTTLVSVSTAGEQGNADSGWGSASAISADGRYVVFAAAASNLVPGDSNGALDVFVHDRQTKETTRVSVSTGGGQGNSTSHLPSISADGRYVVFASDASNLAPGDSNPISDIFVHDRQTTETILVSVASSGVQSNRGSVSPAISPDGRYVAFVSGASNLVPGDNNGVSDIFVHDRQTKETTRASISSDGKEGNADSGRGRAPAISADGRYVVFASDASNLVPGDSNGVSDVFVHDRQTKETALVSVSTGGEQGDGHSGSPAVSADGRYVAFASAASNLLAGDGNAVVDVFVHDRQTKETSRVSVSTSGGQGSGLSTHPSISADGRYVVFYSAAKDLVPGSTNAAVYDVFIHDRQTKETAAVSVSKGGERGNSDSNNHSVSADGRHVAFNSAASNLVPGDNNSALDVFVADVGPRGVPDISVSPLVVDFGWVSAGGSSLQSFTVSNKGNGDLKVASIQVVGTEFSLTSNTCTDVIPGGSCSASVGFAPTSKGTKEVVVRIASDDPDSPILFIQLRGACFVIDVNEKLVGDDLKPDPLVVLFGPIWAEVHYPPQGPGDPIGADVERFFLKLTPKQKKIAVDRARILGKYVKAVEEADARTKGARQ